MSATPADVHGHDHDHGEAHEHHGPPKGITRWLYTTNHKDIGTMYLWFACTMFFVGGTMALAIRAELFEPGLQFFDPQFLIPSPRCTAW
jgi:cytochrome c oxidase subunit 1